MALVLLLAALVPQVSGQVLTSFTFQQTAGPTTSVQGDVPQQIEVVVSITNAFATDADGDQLVLAVTSAQNLFPVTAPTTTSDFTLSAPLAASGVVYTAPGTLTVTLAGGNTLPTGTSTFTITPTSGTMLTMDATPVDFSLTTTDNDGSGGGGGLEYGTYQFTAASGGGAGGDPITFWNGNKTKFWLPMKTEVALLETPHLILWATPLQGPTEDLQWFESFKVTSPSHEFVAQVDLDAGNDQIAAVVGKSKTPLHSGGVQISNSPVRLAVSDVKLPNNRVHGANKTAYFFVESPEMSFAIFSSYAGTEFPNDVALQTKYQHLNFLPMDIKDYSNFKGALPQMWGLVPMEADTAAMLVPPSEAGKASEPTLCKDSGAVQACMEVM